MRELSRREGTEPAGLRNVGRRQPLNWAAKGARNAKSLDRTQGQISGKKKTGGMGDSVGGKRFEIGERVPLHNT